VLTSLVSIANAAAKLRPPSAERAAYSAALLSWRAAHQAANTLVESAALTTDAAQPPRALGGTAGRAVSAAYLAAPDASTTSRVAPAGCAIATGSAHWTGGVSQPKQRRARTVGREAQRMFSQAIRYRS